MLTTPAAVPSSSAAHRIPATTSAAAAPNDALRARGLTMPAAPSRRGPRGPAARARRRDGAAPACTGTSRPGPSVDLRSRAREPGALDERLELAVGRVAAEVLH